VRHRSDLLGDGVITVIRILLHLFEAKDTPIIIDEPELSLHPMAQKKLIEIIAECSQLRQIIISTHSPYFISWEYLNNGAILNRVSKYNDEYSEVFSIKSTEPYKSLIKGSNWQQPFLLDEVAKEMFFLRDNILFLEGQQDVGLLRSEKTLENANIFGYGVRGYSNFQFALKLSSDLGFKRVSCILDSGEKESRVFEDLKKEFPEYKIIQWNKEDICDKPQKIPKSSKDGYFNSSGKKKPESELDDFHSKLEEIETYFNG
jgi:predicted ATP-dependent endonuclease of OLD family